MANSDHEEGESTTTGACETLEGSHGAGSETGQVVPTELLTPDGSMAETDC